MSVPHEALDQLVVVEGYVATPLDDTDMREEIWSFALDQRAFGPRRLLVAFTDGAGRFLALAHTPRTEPPEFALACCIEYLGAGPGAGAGAGAVAVAAVAFCDEPVSSGPPSPEAVERFTRAETVAKGLGLRLIDWIACDDQLFRSIRLSQEPHLPWDDLP